MNMTFFKELLGPNQQFVQSRDAPRKYKIKLSIHFDFFRTAMNGGHIFKPKGICDLLDHSDFFARTVHEHKFRFWEENSQWNTRETTPSAQVENLGAGFKLNHFGYCQVMEHVPFREVFNVLA